MRSLALAGIPATALVLAACGGGGATADAKELIDTSYVVQTITVDGAEREVLEPVAISFTAQGIGVATPCNPMSGGVTYDGATITIGPLAGTKMACEPALMDQDQVLAEALQGTPQWSLTDGQLTLTGGGTVIVGEAALLAQ
jgi:heat shock protein HslJ